MKTWILVAASSSAAIFLFDSVTQSTHLIRNFRNRKDPKTHRQKLDRFAKYLCEEIEIACGAGTGAYLVLFGEKNILKKLSSSLSNQIRSVLVQQRIVNHLESPSIFPDELKGAL